jgi:GNAT superfamily N-acetyltransferase
MSYGVFDQLTIRSYEPEYFEAAVKLNEAASRSTGMGPETGDWAADITGIIEDISKKGGKLKVGILSGDLVVMGGFMFLSKTVAEIRRMRVAPDLQGKGIGRNFLVMLEEQIVGAGIRTIILGTTEDQVGAQRLYSSSGYTEVSQKNVDGLVHICYKKHT